MEETLRRTFLNIYNISRVESERDGSMMVLEVTIGGSSLGHNG